MDDDYPCIIGSACRLPGAVLRPQDLWALFSGGDWQKCSTSPPNSRAFASASASTQSDTFGIGGWLSEEGIEQFDPAFFGIPFSEAAILRPNVRLGLELTYEALQNAGIPPSTLRGKNVSVYVGLGTEDGWDMTRWLTDGPDAFGANWAASSDPSGVSGRISHTFDFRGSSNIASNACASGAIALSEGINSLRYGGAEVAIVGALATHFSPAPFAWAHSTGVISPSHRSSAFSSGADGYSPSEGAVFFVLRNYASAKAAGDSVQAIIRSVASGHNGSTRTLITPSVSAQVTVIEKALNIANLQPKDITLFEAHGTGTRVGDTLEAEGIRAVFRTRTDDPLLLSSSKTVTGHCHGAAALVGVLKVIGCFANRQVPPHQVAPLPEFLSGPVIIPTESQRLTASKIFAQVNSSGFTGTVASIVLEAPTAASTFIGSDHPSTSQPQRWLFPFSAKSKTSFLSQIQRVARWALDTKHPLRDVSTLLGICRDHFPEYRRAFIFSSLDEFTIFLGEDLSYENLMQIVPPASDIQADARITRKLLNIRSTNASSVHYEASTLDSLIEDGFYIEAALNLYNEGHSLSFHETYQKSHIDPAIITSFPLYPFDRKRWWKDALPRGSRNPQPLVMQSEAPGGCEDHILNQESFETLIETYGAGIPVLSIPKVANNSTTQTYLLTGSNGMLGSRLLCRFLQDQDVTVYCIVRGDPTIRIRSAFEKFKLDISAFNDALSKGTLHLMQTSDLCGAKLGLSDADYTVLLNNVDHIVHLAWPVNFNLPLSAFHPFLACTRMLVELCYAAKKHVKLHFTGSYASTFRFPSALVPERELIPNISDSLSQGYAISKLVAEHSLIRIHRSNPSGFRLSVLRVGQICGDTDTGSWASDELMPMVIASIPALRALPDSFPPLAWIPSDICTNALFDITTARETPDLHIVHLANPTVTPWVEAAVEIGKAALGEPPTLVNFPEYVSRIKEHKGPLPVRRLLPYFEHLAHSMPERYAVLEVADSLRFSRSLASCLPITASFLGLIVKRVLEQSTDTPSHPPPIASKLHGAVFVFGPSTNQDLSVHDEVLDRIMTFTKGSHIRLEDESENGSILQQQLRTLASQLSIVERLAACGIRPSAVVGYCFGEYAAAISSGILSEATAVDLLVRRAAALENQQGAMLNVFCDIETVRIIIARLSSPPSIAIIAGPKHIVLSGSSTQILGAKTNLQKRRIKTLDVDTLIPFHSALMDKAIASFVPPVLTPRQSVSVDYISGITASSLSCRSMNVNYWLRHMREPVDFYGSMRYVRRMFPDHSIIDVGPGTTLSKIIGHYGWTDLRLLSPNEARLSKQMFVNDHITQQKLHFVPLPSGEISTSPSTTPDLYAIALHLLQELFGYEISPRLLHQSLHVTGLQSLDFIRFSDYYNAKTGIHLSLSAYISDSTLEMVITEADKNRV